MELHLFELANGKTLKAKCERVAKWTGDDTSGWDDCPYWHNFELFACHPRTYVVRITFEGKAVDRAVYCAEVGAMTDVAKVLTDYDPVAHVPGEPDAKLQWLRERYSGRIRRFRAECERAMSPTQEN